MVASLQARRDALEAILREKTLELKQLCIQEAELTGILPPETPIAPGERPPIFSHRVDPRTKHLQGNVENRWFQRGSQISVNSNGFHVYSSTRHLSKPEYHYSSSEHELNNIFRQVHIHKAPPSYEDHIYRSAASGNWNRNQWYRHSVSQIHHNPEGYVCPNWPKKGLQHNKSSADNLRNNGYATLPKDNRLKSQYDSLNCGQRLSHSNTGSSNFSRRHLYAVPPPLLNHDRPQSSIPSNGHTSLTLPEDAAHHRSLSISSPFKLDTRISSRELHKTYPEPNLWCTSSSDPRHLSSQSLNLYSVPEKGPCQFPCNSLGRKKREKEWRETSLDTTDSAKQRYSSHSNPRTPNIPASASFQRLLSRHCIPSSSSPLQSTSDSTPASSPGGERKSLMELSVQMASNVPLESPINHTVVETGKWKPYRESTKPFEMSDVYKYSTKFKNKKT